MKVKYSVVVPCFNEQETINAFYDAVIPIMEETKEKYELIFVNDGSRDKTEEILKELASKLIFQEILVNKLLFLQVFQKLKAMQ